MDTGASAVAHLVDEQDVALIMHSQRNMLSRFEKTNEMLVNCNALAAIRFERASRDLRAHTQLLEELRKDMDTIFRRIRSLRSKLSHEMPEAFTACTVSEGIEEKEDEDKEEDEVNF